MVFLLIFKYSCLINAGYPALFKCEEFVDDDNEGNDEEDSTHPH